VDLIAGLGLDGPANVRLLGKPPRHRWRPSALVKSSAKAQEPAEAHSLVEPGAACAELPSAGVAAAATPVDPASVGMSSHGGCLQSGEPVFAVALGVRGGWLAERGAWAAGTSPSPGTCSVP
jgi:hypothetical protein